MDRRPDMVQIFDPERPGAPVSTVPTNFNPGLGHKRWEYRPTAQPIDWQPIVLGAMGIPPALDIAEDVPAEDAASLREAHAGQLAEADKVVEAIARYNLRSIEDMAAAGMVAGVNSDTAAKLIAYARAHPFLPAAVLAAVAAAAKPEPVDQNDAGDAQGAPSDDKEETSEGQGAPDRVEPQESAGARRKRRGE